MTARTTPTYTVYTSADGEHWQLASHPFPTFAAARDWWGSQPCSALAAQIVPSVPDDGQPYYV